MDFITHLPVTKRGFDAIMVVVDHFSKWSIFIPCKTTIDAVATAHLFFNGVICRFGVPQKIISDCDPSFTSLFWDGLFKLLGCKLNLSSAYHP